MARFMFLYVINHLRKANKEIEILNEVTEQLVELVDLTDEVKLIDDKDSNGKLLN